MIIIVGPMIGSSSVPLLMLLLIEAMIAIMIVGSFNDMVIGSGAHPQGDPFSLGVSGSAGLDEQRRGFVDELLREHTELLGFERQVGQIGRDKCRNCLGLRGVALSLDRLTVGASRQPEFMDGPHSGIRRYDANRLSLLVDCHRIERRGILKPVEPFDLHGA
jgi:hypothetical protein